MKPNAAHAALATATFACAAPARFGAADRLAVENVLEAQAASWNRGDLPGYMAGYAHSPELVFTSGGKIRRGYDEAAAAYQSRYGQNRSTMGRLDFTVLGVQAVGSDGAVVLGRWVLTETPQAGSGIFSVILERQPGGWKIVHDHTSSAP